MEKIIENIEVLEFVPELELPINKKLPSRVVFKDKKSNVIKELKNVSELDIECNDFTYIIFRKSGGTSVIQLDGSISCSVKESDNEYKIRCEAME